MYQEVKAVKSVSKVYYVVAALCLIWAAISFYDYAVIGKDVLAHYSGESIVLKLVNRTLAEGIIKALLAAAVFAAGLRKAKKRKEP